MSDSENSNNLLEDLAKTNTGLSQKYKEQNAEYKERAAKLGNDKTDKVSYDNMDYGDEFNDDEEERYAKENFGGKSS